MTQEIKGSSVLILGFGLEGQSVLTFLQKQYPDVTIGIADQKSPSAAIPGSVKSFFGDSYLTAAEQFDTVVRSPTFPMYHPALKGAKHITTATNLFFAHQPGTVIGVTGTKGKSTTSALIHHLLKPYLPDVRLVGNIGKPALDFLTGATKETHFVMEFSSFQLEDCRYSPHFAVMLNIVPEHLDHHGNFEAYIDAKANITKYQTETDFLVVNPDNVSLQSIIKQTKAHVLSFENNQKAQVKSPHFIGYSPEFTREEGQNEVPLKGPGNVQNILAAVTVANHFNLSATQIRTQLSSFQPLPHRLQRVGTYRGITFINDSLATNPVATMNAIQTYGSQLETLIVGGYDRGLDYQPLSEFLGKQKDIKTLILFPDTGLKIREGLLSALPSVSLPQMFDTDSMEAAVRLAYQHTSSGKVCLMSPASASYNMFKDYADRGETFIEWVKKLNN